MYCCASLREPEVRPTIAAYLMQSAVEIQQCRDTVERSAANVSSDGAISFRELVTKVCGNETVARLDPEFRKAKKTVRWERGTKMYLEIHHDQWLSILARLGGGSSQPIQIDDLALESELRELRRIGGKLR